MLMISSRRRLSVTTWVLASAASLYLAGCASQYNYKAGFTPAQVQILWNTNGPVQTADNPVDPAPTAANPYPVPPVQNHPTMFGAILTTTPLGPDELNAVAATPGTFVYTPAEGAFLPPGLQTISTTFTPQDTTHYATTTYTAQINVYAPTDPGGLASLVPQSVQIVGGGYVDGVFFHPLQQYLEYVRTDVGGAYRWVQQGTAPQTLKATCPSYYKPEAPGAPLPGQPGYTPPEPTGPKGQNGELFECGYWQPLLDFVSPANPGDGAGDMGVESLGLDPSDPNRLYLATGLNYNNTPPPGEVDHFYLSDDQGNTFTQVPAPFPINGNDNGRDAGERFGVDPNLGTTIYYGSRKNGLWKSLDRGMTWNQVTSFPVTGPTAGAGVVFVTFDAKSGATGAATPVIYVGVSDYNYYSAAAANAGTPTYSPLYRSTDGGVTWVAIPGQPTTVANPAGGATPANYNLTPIHSAFGADGVTGSDGSLYVTYFSDEGPAACSLGSTAFCAAFGTGGGAVYKYTPTVGTPDGAGTWTNITPSSVRSSADSGGFSGITLDAEVPGTVMVSTLDDYNNGDGIYRSLDYGSTWRTVVQGSVGGPSSKVGVNDGFFSPWLEFSTQNPIVNSGNWPTTVAIDPFNSNHAAYGTGQTLYDTQNLEALDANLQVNFTVGAYGSAPSGVAQVDGGSSIEETVVLALSAPPVGAPLLSSVGDLGTFIHLTLEASPPLGAAFNPLFTTGTSVDFEQNAPLTVVRVGTGGNGLYTTKQQFDPTGALCTPATASGTVCTSVSIPELLATTTTQGGRGAGWTALPTLFDAPDLASVTPTTTFSKGGGTVAISSDGTSLLWATSDFPPACSADTGNTFTAATGAVIGGPVVSDRITPGVFYQYDPATGNVLSATATIQNLSTGQFVCNLAFKTVSNVAGGGNGQIIASFGGAGQILLAISGSGTANGLYVSTNGGVTLTNVGSFTQAYAVGVGAAATNSAVAAYSNPAIYVAGTTAASGYGFYRSIDNGQTFTIVSNPTHLLGSVNVIAGDPINFGRFFIGTGGRGIAYIGSE